MTERVQYGDYIFSHNPAAITVAEGGRTATHICPGRGDVLQRLGPRAREVRCEGCLLAESFAGAAAALAELRRALSREEPGTLFLPGLDPFFATVREFIVEAKGDGKVLPYTILFTEAADQ